MHALIRVASASLIGLLVFGTAASQASAGNSPPPPPPPLPGSVPIVYGPVAQPLPQATPRRTRGPTPVLHRRSGDPEPRKDVDVRFDGYAQLWWSIIEETRNGKMQPWTGDDAAQVASGFSIRRARLAATIDARCLRGRIELGLEGSPRILDAWAASRFLNGGLELWAGQMKVPSTYEVATSARDLDFITRSTFSEQVVNWSLCRSPSNPSPSFGVRTYLRDLGVGLKGRIGGLGYFLMVGNGLGANLYIGGSENKQYLFANDFGAYYYGARITYDLAPLFGRGGARPLRSFELGGHYCRNDHPNALFNDEKTVLDIDRWSWSVDCRIDVLDRVRLTGMVGGGAVDDDYDHDGKRDYAYAGWEAKAVVTLLEDRLDLGFRYDVYEDEFFQNGAVNAQKTATIGLTYVPTDHLRLQLNYMSKCLDSPTDPDLDDDLLVLSAQLAF